MSTQLGLPLSLSVSPISSMLRAEGHGPVRITHGSKVPREHLGARALHGNESL